MDGKSGNGDGGTGRNGELDPAAALPVEVVAPPDTVRVDILPRELQPPEPIRVDVSPTDLRPPMVEPFESAVLEGAEFVSKGLLWIFGMAVGFTLFVPLVLLVAARGDVALAAGLLQEYGKLLKEIGGFGATLFGPLLAFVLGFYFKDRGKK